MGDEAKYFSGRIERSVPESIRTGLNCSLPIPNLARNRRMIRDNLVPTSVLKSAQNTPESLPLKIKSCELNVETGSPECNSGNSFENGKLCIPEESKVLGISGTTRERLLSDSVELVAPTRFISSSNPKENPPPKIHTDAGNTFFGRELLSLGRGRGFLAYRNSLRVPVSDSGEETITKVQTEDAVPTINDEPVSYQERTDTQNFEDADITPRNLSPALIAAAIEEIAEATQILHEKYVENGSKIQIHVCSEASVPETTVPSNDQTLEDPIAGNIIDMLLAQDPELGLNIEDAVPTINDGPDSNQETTDFEDAEGDITPRNSSPSPTLIAAAIEEIAEATQILHEKYVENGSRIPIPVSSEASLPETTVPSNDQNLEDPIANNIIAMLSAQDPELGLNITETLTVQHSVQIKLEDGRGIMKQAFAPMEMNEESSADSSLKSEITGTLLAKLENEPGSSETISDQTLEEFVNPLPNRIPMAQTTSLIQPIVVSVANDPEDFYFYIESYASELFKFRLDSWYKANASTLSTPTLQTLVQNGIYVAWNRDTEVYERVAVRKLLVNNDIEVQSIDRGSSFSALLNQIHPIRREFCSLPGNAFHAKIQFDCHNGWTEDQLQDFRQLVTNQKFLALFLNDEISRNKPFREVGVILFEKIKEGNYIRPFTFRGQIPYYYEFKTEKTDH